MMNRLIEVAELPPTIFAEAKSLQELFFIESRCEEEMYLAAKDKNWQDLERLMPMYADIHLEIMMRLWKEVQELG